MGRLRTIIALISAVQALVIVGYFMGYASSGMTVSRLLFTDTAYRGILMTCVTLQLVLSFAYLICFKKRETKITVSEMLLVVAFISWIVLNCLFDDSSGKPMPVHFVATGCFIFSAGIYLIMTFTDADKTCIAALSIVTAIVVTIATIVLFFIDSPYTWVFEHSSFALFSATHALLFFTDTRDDHFFTVADGH